MTAADPSTLADLAAEYRANAEQWQRWCSIASNAEAHDHAQEADDLTADWTALADLCDLALKVDSDRARTAATAAARRLAARLETP